MKLFLRSFSSASSALGHSGIAALESTDSSGFILFILLLNVFLYCHLSIPFPVHAEGVFLSWWLWPQYSLLVGRSRSNTVMTLLSLIPLREKGTSTLAVSVACILLGWGQEDTVPRPQVFLIRVSEVGMETWPTLFPPVGRERDYVTD